MNDYDDSYQLNNENNDINDCLSNATISTKKYEKLLEDHKKQDRGYNIIYRYLYNDDK